MKNKASLQRLLKEFLKTSPRARANTRNGLLPPEYHMNLSKLPTDQQYIKNFIVHLDVSYMYQYYGPLTINEQKSYLQKKSFLNPLSNGLSRRKSIQINDSSIEKKNILMELIKLLNKDKLTILRYIETQEFINQLTVKEVKENKKFIIFLYKWLLNEKYKFMTGSVYQQLCQETSEIIVKKIYEAHQKGDNELLRNTEEQLLVIENLQKARENKRIGDFTKAKQNYEIVYWAKMSQEIDKVEALQYLCQTSTKNNDSKYLNEMIENLRQTAGIISHEKIIKKAIKQIEKCETTSTTTKQQQEFFEINDISLKTQQEMLQEIPKQPIPGVIKQSQQLSSERLQNSSNNNGNNN